MSKHFLTHLRLQSDNLDEAKENAKFCLNIHKKAVTILLPFQFQGHFKSIFLIYTFQYRIIPPTQTKNIFYICDQY